MPKLKNKRNKNHIKLYPNNTYFYKCKHNYNNNIFQNNQMHN
jgi:hypothetical protein